MAKKYSLEMVAVFILFIIYAVCAVILCMIGADIYKKTADSMQANYDDRTSALYIMEKLRQYDQNDSIAIDEALGNDALVLTERYSGTDAKTWLFVKEGTLYETTFDPNSQPDLLSAQKIMALESMRITLDSSDEQLVHIAFTTTEGRTEDISMFCRANVIGGA